MLIKYLLRTNMPEPSHNKVIKLFKRVTRLPMGHRIFSIMVSRTAPYFSTISPLITTLRPHFCQCLIKKKHKVHNHIKTVHVIAICNGLEMAMGVMAEASIPSHLRWIPKGMSVDYTAKANSDIRCTAQVSENDWKVGNMPVKITAYDKDDVIVVQGTINLWISEKPIR